MRAAVLGSPVAHSLSPALHRAAYAQLGLDWTYDARECDIAALPGLIADLGPEWAGLSLTMPLKAAVLPLLDDLDPIAQRAGAANTVVLTGGRRVGYNTDVPGMAAALAEGRVTASGPATILGGGATARSALVSLAGVGFREVTVYARRPSAASELRPAVVGTAVELAVAPWDEASHGLGARLVVSTVPSGAADRLAASVPEDPGTLFDVVYAPWPTPLARRWEACGGTVIGGLDLLVHQAALQVVLMTGTAVAVADLVALMRPVGLAALATPGSV
jgi:shikimate dehydrogenase